MGSLFQRSEMIEHRKRRWKMPLFASTLTEPVAMGAAMIAVKAGLSRLTGRTSYESHHRFTEYGDRTFATG